MATKLLRPCFHFPLTRLQGAAHSRLYASRFSLPRRRSSFVTTCAADEVLRSLSKNGEVAVLVAEGTQLVQEVIADTYGNVKGTMSNPSADPPLREDGKLNVGAAVGRGVLAVVRSHPKNEQPYQGMIPIATGEVAEDLARYLADSEQTNSALALGVSINRDTSIRSAGGFLIQVLPFAGEDTLRQLEVNLASVPSVTELLHQGLGRKDITARLLEGIGLSDVPSSSLCPRYGPCEIGDLQDRMKRAVALLGPEEVKNIMREEGKIEVTCEFCRETYQFEQEEVLAAV
ncbi:MAG: hypothetical protein FRX49_08325 [Trebouxia sp. A1-2]|nr:MAG: hypothetical protein FRX49_08325 [Trebouxia sp. A1-2]